MADVNIKGQISIDTSAAEGSMTSLNLKIKDAKKVLHDAKIGSDEYKAAQLELKAAQKELTSATEIANGTHGKSSEAFSILKGKVQGLVPGLQGAEGGVGSFGKALKVLAMNPIMLILTAIVAVLTFVYEAFNNTSAGAKKTGQVMAGISATFEVLKDAAFILGRSLIDVAKALFYAFDAAQKFLSFDFKGAKESWEKAKDSAKEVGSQVSEAAALVTKAVTGQIGAQAAAYEKQAQEIKKRQRQADEDKKEVELKLKKSKELLMDVDNHDMAAKKKALAEVTAAEKSQAAVDLDLADRRLANRKRVFALETDGEKKHADEMSQLTMAVNDAKIQSLDVQLKMDRQKKQLYKQGDAIEKEAADAQKERDDKAKERAEAKAKMEKDLAEARQKGRLKEIKDIEAMGKALQIEDDRLAKVEKERVAANVKHELENKKKVAELFLLSDKNSAKLRIELIKTNLALELNALEDGDLQKQILAKKAADEIEKINGESAKAELTIQKTLAEQKIALAKEAGQALIGLSDVVGKHTVIGKGLAAAAALMNTYQGISAGVKLGYPQAIPAVIMAAATGFGAVKNILATKVPGASGGNSFSMPNVATAMAPLMPKSSNTRLDQSSINGIGNAAQGGTNRTFVLDSDIKNSAERMARINRAARLN